MPALTELALLMFKFKSNPNMCKSSTQDYLITKSIADHKAPADIIGEMIRERIELPVRAAAM
ncbi:MAG: hypothetical protein LBH43_08415 [Treponema sp.]|jgi:hypothetical protein|nr:hypothetical protein [Treponema sp.]